MCLRVHTYVYVQMEVSVFMNNSSIVIVNLHEKLQIVFTFTETTETHR